MFYNNECNASPSSPSHTHRSEKVQNEQYMDQLYYLDNFAIHDSEKIAERRDTALLDQVSAHTHTHITI